jgi:CPA2 family monovalent cation:H+ antiporter-2
MEHSAEHLSMVPTLLAVLASSAFVTLVFQRIRLAAVPANLITGVLIGPGVLGLVRGGEELEGIAHFAVILLMFGIGLELNLSVLRHGLGRAMAAGMGSSAACIGAGWPLGLAFGLHPAAALTLAMGFSLSSTAVVLRIIGQKREIRNMKGRLSFTILIVQDMIVIGMLAILPVLAEWRLGSSTSGTGDISGIHLLGSAVLRVGGVALMVFAARKLLPLIIRESLYGRSLEVMMIVGVALAMGAAEMASLLGFSLEMGAFIAGFVLAGTPFRHQLIGQIGPLRDLFISVFFTTLGMKLDPSVALEYWWVLLLGGALVTGVKVAAIGFTCWGMGATAGTAVAVGFALAQAGEFTLILFDTAQGMGVLGAVNASIAISIVVVSLLLTPFLYELGSFLGDRLRRFGSAPWVVTSSLQDTPRDRRTPGEERVGATVELKNLVLVAGYGYIGRRVTDYLENAGYQVTVIELNPKTVGEERDGGPRMVFGDASNTEVLESAGIEEALGIVLTIPDEEAVLRACSEIRAHHPDLFIAARTGIASREEATAKSGASVVVSDEGAAALSLLAVVRDQFARDSESAFMGEE